MTIPQEVLQELEWWELAVRKATPIQNPPITDFLVTDAASYGWGSYANTTMAGVWDHHHTSWHLNQKELHAIYKAVTLVVDTIGQPNSIILSKKPGGNQVSGPSSSGQRHSTLGKCLQHSSRSTIPPKIPERFGGPSVKKPPTTRMAPTPFCDTACVSCIRSSTNRPICLKECTCCKQVLHDGLPRSTGGILQCIHPGVELPPGLAIPTTLSGSQDPYPPQQVSRSVHNLLIIPRWERTFWLPNLKSRVLQGPIKIENLKETLVDTATMRPPAKIDSIILEAWLVQAGKIS